MFCDKCGASNPDGAAFCESCGEAMTSQAPEQPFEEGFAPEVAAPSGKSPLTAIILGVVALVAVVAIFFGVKSLFGGGPEAAIKTYVSAIKKGDVDKVLSVVAPKPMKKYLDDNKSIKKMMEESFEEEFEDIKKVEYEIKDKDKMDKDDVEDLEDSLNASLEMFGDDYGEIKINEAYELEVEFKFEFKDEDDNREEEETFTVYKSGGKWYLYGGL